MALSVASPVAPVVFAGTVLRSRPGISTDAAQPSARKTLPCSAGGHHDRTLRNAKLQLLKLDARRAEASSSSSRGKASKGSIASVPPLEGGPVEVSESTFWDRCVAGSIEKFLAAYEALQEVSRESVLKVSGRVTLKGFGPQGIVKRRILMSGTSAPAERYVLGDGAPATALQYATVSCRLDVAIHLLQLGADPAAATAQLPSPIEIARINEFKALSDLFDLHEQQQKKQQAQRSARRTAKAC
jgi:hypothetical protein